VIGSLSLDDAALRRWLHGLPGVDEVGANGRAAMLATRSIKTTSKAWALDLAIRMIDLTTLEGADTPGAVRSLCAKARRPDPDDPDCPPVAAVCVYNDLVPVAVDALRGSGVAVAAVATAFPSGRASLPVKLADTRDAVQAGADEVDMVIDAAVPVRPVRAGLRADRRRPPGLRRAPRPARPPQGDPGDRRAGRIRQRPPGIVAGDGGRCRLRQTSTGKISPAATGPVTLILLEAVRDWHAAPARWSG